MQVAGCMIYRGHNDNQVKVNATKLSIDGKRKAVEQETG